MVSVTTQVDTTQDDAYTPADHDGLHDALEQYHAIEWEVAQCVEGVEEAACQWLANMDEDIEEVTVEAEYSH
jgi:hypothetical protein